MGAGPRFAIRAARRSDLQALTELRMRYLGEAAHMERRLRLMPDARVRTEQALPVWLGQDDRVLLIALPAALEGEDAEGDDAEPVGYAMGLLKTVPPILERQHVGEILEVYLDPAHRGKGLGAALVEMLTQVLVGRGAEVLRAAIPSVHADARQRFERAGYAPLQVEMERALDAG